MEKICKCGYETTRLTYKFCPLCGTRLETVLEKDGTYKAEKYPCKVKDDMFDQAKIYYYKVNPDNNKLVWIYSSKESEHFIAGCHISKIRTVNEESMKKCIFRKNGECGHTATCKKCKMFADV